MPWWKSEHGAVRDVSTKPTTVSTSPTTMTGHDPSPRLGRASSGGRGAFATSRSGSTGADALSSVSTRIGQSLHEGLHAAVPSASAKLLPRGLDATQRIRQRVRAATSSASGSWKSRSSGIPAVRRTALSRTLLAGRGAGRGGSSSEVEIGRTTAGSRPAAATTAWANSNHVTAPWLVTWWTPPRRSSASRRSIGARSAVNVGQPRWSSTNARRPGVSSPAASRRRIVATMFAPCSPHTHDVRTTVAALPRTSASRSPASFDDPYTPNGFGRSNS